MAMYSTVERDSKMIEGLLVINLNRCRNLPPPHPLHVILMDKARGEAARIIEKDQLKDSENWIVILILRLRFGH